MLRREGRNPGKPRRVGIIHGLLSLLVFGVVLFPNIDELVDLAGIDVFLAYHHNKESPVITVLVDVYDTFDLRCENSSVRIVCCTPAFYAWLVSHVLNYESRFVYPLQGHRMCLGRALGRCDGVIH